MKKFLEIKSKGKIDVQAFSLIGASSKRNDNSKIGMYGSGNKYAISTLLRKEIENAVFNLRTYKAVQENFPEAFEYLPTQKTTSALALNISDLRNRIND